MAISFPNPFAIAFISGLGFLLIYLGKTRRKFRMLLIASGVFIIVHLIVFPLIYLQVLSMDQKSFSIESNLLESVKLSATNTVTGKYIPVEKEVRYLTALVNSKNQALSKSINYLHADNLLLVDSLYLFKTTEYIKSPGGPLDFPRLTIANLKGQKILTFSSLVFDRDEISVKTVLKDYLAKRKSEKTDLVNEMTNISKNNVWTYLRLLPYSINIYDTGNFNPIAASANVIFAIHKFLVPLLILGLFSGIGYDIFTSHFKDSE